MRVPLGARVSGASAGRPACSGPYQLLTCVVVSPTVPHVPENTFVCCGDVLPAASARSGAPRVLGSAAEPVSGTAHRPTLVAVILVADAIRPVMNLRM